MGTIKATEYNSMVTKLNALSKTEGKGTVSTIASVTAGSKATASQFTLLQTAINKLEASFSGNCCQSANTNCCQTCQSMKDCTTTCQSCQKTTCQSCQGTSCQSCQSQSCQKCQSCQTCQSQCDCNCNCNCSDCINCG